MHLIVAEKNITAQRIAQILAKDHGLTTKREGGVNTYSFDQTVVVGLRGHVVEVDFEPGYGDWRSPTLTPRSLIEARTIKVPSEKKIVNLIQKLAKKADLVTIATDFDTEGELIGKETFELIRNVNPRVPVDRARFSSITAPEIVQSFGHTVELDFDLAAAGEARQEIDLIWGASLTRFISLAAHRGGKNILSVGRVQSPTLAMIVDREREILEFVPEKYWTLSLLSTKNGQEFEARHRTARFTDHAEANAAKDRTKEPLVVMEVTEGEKTDRPPAPFDTTAFIVAAGRSGFSASNAMRIAENLYMNGFISYPRTDNTVYPRSLPLPPILAMLGSTIFAKDAAWVAEHRRSEPTRGKKLTTDHPPIHPSAPATRELLGDEQFRIYELVVRRFLATLSPDARWKTVKCALAAGEEPYIANGSTLVQPGWRRVYPYGRPEEHDLPALSAGERLPVTCVTLEEKETQPPARYSQSRLVQHMEELGLGTKSTRHEVIAKLIERRYVEGNPLRPTPVGCAVTQALEKNADTITQPDMTRTLETHMQLIKEKGRSRDDVVAESRRMLHDVFRELEAHEQEIGAVIMERADEEMVLGKCPACGGDLRIRTMRGQSQFIGCSNYPECNFNINLPGPQWGKAIRTTTTCAEHGLCHTRLIRKGVKPWDLGCPLCSHITSNLEALKMIPHLSEELIKKLHARHVYTVSEVAASAPEGISDILDVNAVEALDIIRDAKVVLVLLRKRSDLRSFVRKNLPPRKGRSISTLMGKLFALEINDVRDLSRADAETLKAAGISDTEAKNLLEAVLGLCNERILRESGIPPGSLKKYREAGITKPEDFFSLPAEAMGAKAGIRTETVRRHIGKLSAVTGKKPLKG